jgi:hypothetical protein
MKGQKMTKKSVAVVGFAWDSLQYAKDSQADEMWTVNFAWNYAVPRIDRLFEIHPIEVLAFHAVRGKEGNRDEKHFAWLQEEHNFPIYTYADYTGVNILDELGSLLDEWLISERLSEKSYQKYLTLYQDIIETPSRIPNSVPYPFEKLDSIFEHLHRENRPTQVYMPSTISYMLATAIFEGWERIEMYGIEMAEGTEYKYQLRGTEALMMYAMGKGIEIYLPEHCKLMNIKPYHKGLQMITRQTLEKHKKLYEQERVDALTKTNFLRGQMEPAEKKKLAEFVEMQKNIDAEKDIQKKNALEKQFKQYKIATEEEILTVVKQASHFQGLAFMADAAVQTCANLIKSIDYDDPLVSLVNRFTDNEIEPELEKVKV